MPGLTEANIEFHTNHNLIKLNTLMKIKYFLKIKSLRFVKWFGLEYDLKGFFRFDRLCASKKFFVFHCYEYIFQ